MQQLFSAFYNQLNRVSTDFKRYLYHEIRWQNRLIAIVGSRGVGKTTLLLQYIKENYEVMKDKVLYASLDNLWFSLHSLNELADEFVKQGGKYLFLDEVHNYPGWSREIKNVYDSYPDLHIVFTGSSLLEVHKGEADLSRRAIRYQLYGMSFREFLEYEHGILVDTLSLEDILENHGTIALKLLTRFNPLPVFQDYLRVGYFPFYKEDREWYHSRLLATLNTIVENDLPAVERIDYYSVVKIKKLFAALAAMSPFTPNISQLSRDIETTRMSLLNYLYYLAKADVVMMLNKESTALKQMAKPDKVFLGNPNYAYALGDEQTNIGSVRELFFMNQMRVKHKVSFTDQTDFLLNGKLLFEIGGKNKTRRQIAGLPNAYLALDNIDIGSPGQIPLWLFGLTY